MIKTTYTQNQLINAIKYWTSKMNILDESINNINNVVEQFNINDKYSDTDINKKALYTLQSVLDETDDQTITNSNTNHLTIRGKVSHSFIFAEFD